MTVVGHRIGSTSNSSTSNGIAARTVAAALAAVVAGSTGFAAPGRAAPPAQAGPARLAAADQTRDRSWQLTQLRVAEAHRVTQGEGMVVAVIDSGVDASHPDLAGSVLPGFDLLDPANSNRGHRDAKGHGTAMASLIAGHGHGPGGRDGVLGIAPKARILPINIYDPKVDGFPRGAYANAIRLAVNQGAHVICIASGGSSDGSEPEAVKYARERNVLVVAAVGNPPLPLPGSPANIQEVVAVTGFDRNGTTITTVRGDIDIAAPAGDVISARPGGRYNTATGTSNATAIVAGAVALIRARYPDADRNEQLRRLVWTTTDMGEPGNDGTYGWGSLNLVDALTVEPREPGRAAPTATSAAAAQQAQAVPGQRSEAGRVGLLVASIGGVLVLAIVGLVVWLVRARRRRVPVTDSGVGAAGSTD